jgi:hypothetical protein
MAFGTLLASPLHRLRLARWTTVYDEPSFRQFLSIERERAEHSLGSFLLVLITLNADSGAPLRIAPPTGAAIFAGLAECLRDVDFAGWYRHERIAAAVLAQAADPAAGATALIADRITTAIGPRLSFKRREQLRVRIVAPRLRGRG